MGVGPPSKIQGELRPPPPPPPANPPTLVPLCTILGSPHLVYYEPYTCTGALSHDSRAQHALQYDVQSDLYVSTVLLFISIFLNCIIVCNGYFIL